MTVESLDLIIRGGRLVLPDGVFEGDLAVRDGRIVALGEAAAFGPAAEVVDARGLHVLAGLVETHAHLREPGHTWREDFLTGTTACAAGGITTVMEMPSGLPPVSTPANFRLKDEVVAPKALIDYGLYGGAGAGNLDQIVPLAEAGVVAYKSFMQPPLPGREAEMLPLCLPDDAAMYAALRQVARSGVVSVIHAENWWLCDLLARELDAAGRVDPLAHGEARPPFAEEEAVGRAILIARETGARISFAHVSTAGAVERIRAAKLRGQAVTAEACPHHLVLTEERMREVGPYSKINPPLRPERERAALWAGLLDGTIDFVGTDHAPYTREDKEPGWRRIWDAPSGAPGLETTLRVLLTQVDRGLIDLPTLTRRVSRRAAQVFGLYPRKGELRVGSDADVTLVDLARRETVDPSRFHTKVRDAATLWEGYETVGAPVATFVRGRAVMRDGEIVGQPGFGRRLSPARG